MMRRFGYPVLALLLTVPGQASAQLPDPGNRPRRIQSQTGFDNIGQPVGAIFDALIVFIPTVAALYVAIAGYRYMVAQGNPELVDRAKKSLLYAVYGLIVAIVSVGLIFMISRALGFNSGLRI